MRGTYWACLAVMTGALAAIGAETNSALVELNLRSFFHGREYFVLRSGRARMIVQADRADVGPAFTYLLFDAENPKQSRRKDGAFNFTAADGFASSALAVRLGGFPFTALGHRTQTCWVFTNGLPMVEAIWWAGGVRITERLASLAGGGLFLRSIQLEGAHLVGEETVALRLTLPGENTQAAGTVLGGEARGARLAVGVLGSQSARASTGGLEVAPLALTPGGRAAVETFLLVDVAPGAPGELLERAKALAGSAGARELAAARATWQTASTVATRDQTVREIFDKARFGLPGMIADEGTMDAGIFEYGAQWVRDTANTALGALHAGHFEIVRGALVRILTKMVSPDGVTMIAGSFEQPDLEQFDQMGELLHLLKAYRDWTGDDQLVREHRDLLLALIERPLHPQFRDATGMVHNRREFWERAFRDAYELAYQTYVILGLREAANLAPALGATHRAARWRAESDRMLEAVLRHPTRRLVAEGGLIKRRNVTGEVADDPAGFRGFAPDVPLNTERRHRLLPDASMALPMALGVVEGRSAVARATLDHLEQLWNTRWTDGGYDRYHTSTQPDQPGPWPFATCFILRAQHEAGQFERSRRSLEWLNTAAGGRTGAWLEEVPSIRSLNHACGIVCWTSGELALFVVRHYLGVRFEGDRLVLRPALYPGSPPVTADLRFRRSRLRIETSGTGPLRSAVVNGQVQVPDGDGALRLPASFSGGVLQLFGRNELPPRTNATAPFRILPAPEPRRTR